ncbi:polygalacturonase QRT3-like [Abrus precatorius]|uniref:Polygalacturonase QRT3-like n=1 Tax=Abrus precatorius TaxID=3816 RepID=A0A8B8K4S8_ABRPR|nr:polygalacturonase QRT3-like [Abrus precatorius]
MGNMQRDNQFNSVKGAISILKEGEEGTLITPLLSSSQHPFLSAHILEKQKSTLVSKTMRFSILSFLLLLVVQEATCFNHPTPMSHFRNKLKDRMVMGLSQAPSPSPDTKRGGRVVYPSEYGADPTGAEDSSDGIMKAVGEAFGMESGLELLPGVRDLGGVIIDLQGGNYTISKPITFPSSGGGNVVVQGGSLRALDKFPTDRHLIELWATNSQKLPKTTDFNSIKLQQTIGIYYEDITFRDILFDSSYKGGGIFIIGSARIRINNCFFLHFTTEGILVQGGHETFISSSFLGQHSTVGGDKGERNFSGTAIDLASNDNAITDIAIFSAAIGVVLRGQANMVTGVHCYNKATGFGGIGILVKLAGNSQTRIDNCYMDYTSIVMEDPVQVHVSNGFFLGDANVVLKSIKGKVFGLNIVDNMFNGNPNNKVPIVALDGQFSNIDQVVTDRNNVIGMSLRSTIGRLTVAGNDTKWVADFSNVLLFPNRISNFQYSFYSQGEVKFLAHSVTNVSNNVVVVESEKPVQGVVSFFVQQ